MKIRNKIIALMISLIAIPTFALAQKSKAYVGAEYTKNKINTGISNVSSTLDEKDNGYSIFLGTEVNKNLDVEISYNDFGKASLSGVNGNQFRYNGTLYQFNQTATISEEATSYGFALRPKMDISKNVDLVGILGVHRWDAKLNVAATTTGGSVSETGTDLFYGLGVKANFDQFSVGLNYSIYKVDSDEIKSWGLRAAYTF
jgi:hypothetical protein